MMLTLTCQPSSGVDAEPCCSRSCVTPQQQYGEPAELTEANLKLHTAAYPSSREKRHARVNAFVDAQAALAQLEAELQDRRHLEMQGMIPLEALPAQEAIVLEHQPSATHAAPTRVSPTWFRKLAGLFGRHSPDPPTLTHPSCSTLPTREPAPPPKSYQHYCQEKTTLIQHGLSGLTNPNIAHALGIPPGERHSVISALFSHPESLSDSSCAKQLPHQQQPKRDSGISLLAMLPSSRSSSDKSSRFSLSFRRSTSSDELVDLVAYRYPKMACVQTIRAAAIQALASELVADSDQQPCSQGLVCCHSSVTSP